MDGAASLTRTRFHPHQPGTGVAGDRPTRLAHRLPAATVTIAGPARDACAPLPPDVWNHRFDALDGARIVQDCGRAVTPARPDTGTPFGSMVSVEGYGLIASTGVHPGFTPSPEYAPR